MESNCERCKVELEFGTQPIKFIGGVYAKLCPLCGSTVDYQIQQHPLFAEYVRLFDRRLVLLALAESGRDTVADVEQCAKALLEVERKLHPIIRGCIAESRTE